MSSLRGDRERLTGSRSSLEDIQDIIDRAFIHLSTVLPDVNQGVFRPFAKALEGMGAFMSLASTPGIDSVVISLKRLLEAVTQEVLQDMSLNARMYETLQCLAPHLETLSSLEGMSPNSHTPGLIVELGRRSQEMLSQRTELMIALDRQQAQGKRLLADIETRLCGTIESFEDASGAVRAVVKDLRECSDSTKGYIDNIMTELQAHDIINQDFDTITCGLSRMLSLVDHAEDPDEIREAISFQEYASLLSGSLITQLILTVREQVHRLEHEIDRMEEAVSQGEACREALAQIVVLDDPGKSTTDPLLREMSSALESFESRLEEFTSMRGAVTTALTRLTHSGGALEEWLRLQHETGASLPSPLSRTILRASAAMRTLHCAPAGEDPFLEPGPVTVTFKDELGILSENLTFMKILFHETIEEIDRYSGRCRDFILLIRNDTANLFDSLEASRHIADEVLGFSSAVRSVREAVPLGRSIDRNMVKTRDLQELLVRLEHPHSSLLWTEKTGNPCGNMTFF